MLKSLFKAWGLVAGLVLSGAVCAVGMGGINVTTSLGQPLRAEIDLVAVGKAEKSGLAANLASPDLYKSAGMDYPYNLPKLKFKVETRANGERYIQLTSIDPVNEPFISMLVELSWPAGKLLREYTFLLDPPGYKAEQPAEAAVTPVAPSVAMASAERPATAISGNSPMRSTAPMEEKSYVAARPVATTAARKSEANSSNVASGAIKVKSGDTLSKIARSTKPADISLERMLVALYRANADEFDGKNMNRLRTGKILRVPETSDLDEVAQADAVKEIHAQAADWNAYRQKLAAAAGMPAEQSPRQAVAGKISATVADKAPPVKESAKEVVKLSKGETPGDKTAAAGGNLRGVQDKLHSMEEEAVAKDKAIREGNERIAVLEKNIKEMQHLLDIKSQTMAQAKPAPTPVAAAAETKPAEPAATAGKSKEAAAPAAPPVVITTDLPPAKHKAAPAPKVVPPPSSMLDQILDEPLYLAGGAAALLGLAGLGLMLMRRGRSGGKTHADVDDGESTGSRIAEPVAPSPETGDFTGAVAAVPHEVQSEEVDPLVEAELFLNFGRDAQAEEILKDALAKDASNNKVALKLLSIHADHKDAKAFSVVAHQVQNSGDQAAWAQAREMGRKLDPGNPTYGGTDAEPSAVVAPEEAKSKADAGSSLDFDLGLGESGVAATGAANADILDVTVAEKAATPEVDFDLGFGESEPETTAAAEHDATVMLSRPLLPAEDVPVAAKAAVDAPLDFDLTGGSTAVVEQSRPAGADAPNLEDMMFDITGGLPAAETVPETQAAAPDISPDKFGFTLDFPVAEETQQPQPTAQAASAQDGAEQMGGISLNLDDDAAATAGEVKDAHWHDVATKLDLSKAYQEMGDAAGAREILLEVLDEGDEQQRAAAEAMLQQLPPA